jgi:predicted lipoprotein with Yx(FWY)xxD motif
MMRLFPAILCILLALVIGCTQQAPMENNATACTAEAKICPDGTAVGRTGPNCEFAPCPQVAGNDSGLIVGNDSDEHGCKASAGYSWCEEKQKCMRVWEEACQGTLTGSEVMGIAQEICGNLGNLSNEIKYNENTRTYWVDIQTYKEGCSPACVVDEENRTAEVNWRCTGLIPPYTVKTANSSLGEILVDGNGFTLYTYASDTVNESACYGVCAQNWPPLLIYDTIAIPKGLIGEFGAILRNDSTLQVTYNGMPLYLYVLDKAPGDTKGDNLNGKWFVAKPGE